MVRGSTYGIAAYDGDNLVGYARALSDGAFNAYVSTVAVLPEYQRQGIGRALMSACSSEARVRTKTCGRLLEGRDHIQFVLHADPPVHPFYLRCGFRPAPDMLRRDRSH